VEFFGWQFRGFTKKFLPDSWLEGFSNEPFETDPQLIWQLNGVANVK